MAKGCGQNIHEINQFIKQFEQMRKMMHKMTKNPAMMANLPGMGGAGANFNTTRKRR